MTSRPDMARILALEAENADLVRQLADARIEIDALEAEAAQLQAAILRAEAGISHAEAAIVALLAHVRTGP